MKLVDKNTNKINYGIFDEKIEYNWHDYDLHNFWDKKVGKFKQKFGFHKFHFISFTNQEYVVGLAIVDLSIAKNIFGYVYHKDQGVITKWQKDILNSKMVFNDDIDNNQIEYRTRNLNMSIKRNFKKGIVDGHFQLDKKIALNYQIELSLKQKPLRVVNPIDFEHWSFTEKRAGLKVNKIEVVVNNKTLNLKPNNTLACTDWSGGFFRRSTNWAWGSGTTKIDNHIIGFNFATFHNNAFYPENAIWFDNQREHLRDVIFKWNYMNPYKEGMKIYTPDKRLYLHFEPIGQKSDVNSRALGLIKTNFHQFFGYYTGYITVNNKQFKLPKFLGLFELHKALW